MEEPIDKLFVYGVLLDAAERRKLLGREVATQDASLKDYRRGRQRYFFVAPEPTAAVKGALLLGLTDDDFVILDRFEDVPRLYVREIRNVHDSRGNLVQCWIYLPTGWERD